MCNLYNGWGWDRLSKSVFLRTMIPQDAEWKTHCWNMTILFPSLGGHNESLKNSCSENKLVVTRDKRHWGDKMGEGECEVQTFSYGMKKSWEWEILRMEYSQQYCNSGRWWLHMNIALYRLVESLCCTFETHVTLCVNYTLIKKN